jgi:hypothetical protein
MTIKVIKITLLFCVLSILFSQSNADPVHITGSVLDEAGNPLATATVRVQTTENSTVTDSNGRFTLDIDSSDVTILTAWKKGYINGGTELVDGRKDIIITLKPVPPDDNADYLWLSADPPTPAQRLSIAFWNAISLITGNDELKSRSSSNCSNCHESPVVDQWRQDAHSNSAVNPILMTMYNGTDMDGNPGVFPGYKLDFPNANGNCATCHAPVQAVNDPWGTDMNNIKGVAREGISCDFCHKIRGVDLHPDGGYPGVLSIQFNRPPGADQIFYGPYDDVIAGPDTFDPLYKKSLYCAPCHSAKFWGVPIYTDYDEWLESSYPDEGVECQGCHMTPDGVTTHFVPLEKGGMERNPETIATHTNPGCRNVKFMSDAIRMDVETEKTGDTLEIIVNLTNEKAGHHYPTGVPMRNMILLLEVFDSNGEKVTYIDGPIVPKWGGIGSPENGNYAGLPGKGFAKILSDAPKNYPRFNTDIKSPTPHWRQAVIVSDNRIPARETDISRYLFRLDTEECDTVIVSARLIYRRAFKPWIDAKGWPLEDLEIAKMEFIHQPRRIHLSKMGNGRDTEGIRD